MTLTQAYNADQLTAAEDGPLSPDNLAVTKRFVVDQRGRDRRRGAGRHGLARRHGARATAMARSGWCRRQRAGDPATFKRVAELVGRGEGGRDNITTGSGIWETSGIVDARRAFGRGTFLFDVQATRRPPPPGGKPLTLEDGQLLLLKRGGGGGHGKKGNAHAKKGRGWPRN